MTITKPITVAAITLSLAASATGLHAAENGETPNSIRIGTASVGGTYHAYGSAWARLVGSELDMNSTAQTTGGPMQNIPLVSMGDLEFGQAVMVDAYDGYHGEGWAEDQEAYDDIRAVFPMYPSYWHFWAEASSGIDSVNDLEGKRVVIGPVGGTPDIQARLFFPLLGIEPDSMINAGFSDANQLMRDGQADATFTTSGIPHPSPQELQSTRDLNIFGFTGENAERYMDAAPLAECEIPADTYQNQPDALETVCGWDVVVTHKDLSNEFVYNVVKAVMENNDDLVNGHASAKDTLAENVQYVGIPLHPGAAKYYREQGISIPDAATPVD